ncbi:hypothetical protein [Streptomyces sp. NPDC047315]|uniref:hypothetical protein n=1 Tax=Streptomyces sp. NPDC047315 TaxID=3155142 RepID=UPI0033D85CFE
MPRFTESTARGLHPAGRGRRPGPWARTATYAVAALVAATALVLSGPGVAPASAAPAASPARAAPADDTVRANALCTGRLVKSVRFRTGELRVYKNARYACAVTLAKAPGPRRAMSVSLQSRGGRTVTDRGSYTRRAGPLSAYAHNRCVRASGSVAGAGGATGWILC